MILYSIREMVEMAIRRLKNGEIKRDYSREFENFIAHANESH